MSEVSLERDDIERYVSEVADELAGSGVQRVVIIVGGALLAMHGLRAATRDADSVPRLDEELTAAIARVASRHGLAPRWLNDSALPFLPATFDEDACETILVRKSLWPATSRRSRDGTRASEPSGLRTRTRTRRGKFWCHNHNKWAMGDSNPRPPACRAGALTN